MSLETTLKASVHACMCVLEGREAEGIRHFIRKHDLFFTEFDTHNLI